MNRHEADRGALSVPKLAGWHNFRRLLVTLAVLLVTFGVMFFLLRQVNIAAVKAALANLGFRFAIPAVGLMGSIILIVAARWKLVLLVLGHRITVHRSVYVILAASALNAVVPAKAGNLVKVASLRGVLPMSTVLGGAITEALLDMSVLGLFAFGGGLSTGHTLTAFSALAIAGAAAAFMLFSTVLPRVPLPDRLHAKLVEFSTVMVVLRRRPLEFMTVIGATVISWSVMIVLVWLLYSGIGAEAPFLQVCRALPLAILAGLLPLTLSGIGTRDAALIVLMTPVATEAQSLAVGLLYTVIVYWLPALCGATVLRRALTSK